MKRIQRKSLVAKPKEKRHPLLKKEAGRESSWRKSLCERKMYGLECRGFGDTMWGRGINHLKRGDRGKGGVGRTLAWNYVGLNLVK